MIRGSEWIIILIIALIVLGPTKLPGLARSVGKAYSEFRSSMRKAQEDLHGLAKEVNPLADPPPEPPKPEPTPQPETKQTAPEEKNPDAEIQLVDEKKDNGVVPEPDYPEDA